MPLYEYRCNACGHLFEQIQKFSDPPVDVCPNCGERNVQKLLSSPAIQFKGTGWYITDYARKERRGRTAHAKAGGNTDERSRRSTENKRQPIQNPIRNPRLPIPARSSSSSTSSSPSTTTPTPPSTKTS